MGERPMEDTRQVVLTGYRGRTAASVLVVSYDRARRVRRALRGLATWWGAALVSVLIPIAHFVLVPSFFFYGVYTFARRLTADQVAVSGRGICPDCGREQALDVAGRWSVPRTTSCRYCQRSLRITADLAGLSGWRSSEARAAHWQLGEIALDHLANHPPAVHDFVHEERRAGRSS